MADEKMQNENKKSLNTREDNVAEDIRREAAGKDAEMAADKTTEKEGAPKKKNLAFVVRPQNSKNSSRLQGKRPDRDVRDRTRVVQTVMENARQQDRAVRMVKENRLVQRNRQQKAKDRFVQQRTDRHVRHRTEHVLRDRRDQEQKEQDVRVVREDRYALTDRDRNHLETDVLMARTEAKTEDHVRTETDADSVLTEEDVTDSRDATTVMEERTVTEETDADRDSALTEEMTIAETTEVTLHRS